MLRKFALSFGLLITSTLCTTAAQAAVIDIAFIMDSSTSLGDAGWESEKAFVSNFVEQLDTLETPDVEYRFGVVKFSSTVQTVWDFADAQDPLQDILDAIDSMSFLGGTTHTRSAIDTTLDMFANTSTSDAIKHAFLITDGNPYPLRTQNPCSTGNIDAAATRDNLAASGVDMTIVGVDIDDKWDPSLLDCLVNDPDRDIFQVNDFSNSALGAVSEQLFADFSRAVSVSEPTTLPLIALGMGLLALRRARIG